jgi:hypothetical protein
VRISGADIGQRWDMDEGTSSDGHGHADTGQGREHGHADTAEGHRQDAAPDAACLVARPGQAYQHGRSAARYLPDKAIDLIDEAGP